MGYLVMVDGDSFIKFRSKEEAKTFIDNKIMYGGFYTEDLKIYKIEEIIKNINKVNLTENERDDLLQELKPYSLEDVEFYNDCIEKISGIYNNWIDDILLYVDEEGF